MTIMTAAYFDSIKDYVHPNVNKFINYYRNGNRIELPPFHGCRRRNKNGTRKFIDYTNCYQCVTPSWRRYWKKDIKPKYKTKYGFFYWTRYMTRTRHRFLFKNTGYYVYNYRLKKYEHMNDTPMNHDFKWMQRFKKEYLFKNALP